MSERSRIKTGWARMRAWQRGSRRAAMAAALAGKGERVPERRSPRLARLFRDAGLLAVLTLLIALSGCTSVEYGVICDIDGFVAPEGIEWYLCTGYVDKDTPVSCEVEEATAWVCGLTVEGGGSKLGSIRQEVAEDEYRQHVPCAYNVVCIPDDGPPASWRKLPASNGPFPPTTSAAGAGSTGDF